MNDKMHKQMYKSIIDIHYKLNIKNLLKNSRLKNNLLIVDNKKILNLFHNKYAFITEMIYYYDGIDLVYMFPIDLNRYTIYFTKHHKGIYDLYNNKIYSSIRLLNHEIDLVNDTYTLNV